MKFNYLYLLLLSISFVYSKFTTLDFLKVNDSQVKNNYGKGNCVYLRGTNVGNLFVQEAWMSSTDAKDQKTINENLERRFGRNYTNTLIERYESSYLTSDDFAKFKELGMSAIRVPFTYLNLYENSGSQWKLKPNAFSRLDWIVNQCSEKGIYVILDLHGAFGSQNGQDHSGEVIDRVEDVNFYSDSNLKQWTLNLWREVASRYNGNPAVAGYDILNEPGEKAGTTKSYHWDFYNEIYNTIRSVDKDHIIIMESCWGAKDLPQPSQYEWKNVMYEFHHYVWDSQQSLVGQKEAANSLINSLKIFNVPIYIGEFTFFELGDAWSYVLNLFNTNGYHYTSWSYKSNNMGTWGIYNQKATDRVNPTNTDENEILRIWGPSVVGTGKPSHDGMVYNKMKENLPGTVYFMKYALENKNYFTLKVLNTNKYVSADEYGMGQLRANRDSTGTWEHYYMYKNSDGTVSIQSRANNKFLCAVFDNWDEKAPVIPRSNQIEDWEKFYVDYVSSNVIVLKTYTNSKYVKNEGTWVRA
eukprot:jgi/Orpsp1_1/1178194/evm.model.c7180000064381.1